MRCFRCYMKRVTAVNTVLVLLVLLNIRLGLHSFINGSLYHDSANSGTVQTQLELVLSTKSTAASPESVHCYNASTPSTAGQQSNRVVSMNLSAEMMTWASIQPGQVQVLGMMRPTKGFLTIGIPSIKRTNGNEYLMMTLQSLINMTSEQEKQEVVIVVFLADMDLTYKTKTAKLIAQKHEKYINNGFLHIVQVSPDFYPNLNNLKRNFRDKPERVKWRSKQVADYAFLFLHSVNISEYYLQLEDDVKSAQDFVRKIRQYIIRQRKKWTTLEFSELGFIGKLFKSSDLHKLAQFMLLFYDEQPVDWLIRYFRMTMTQPEVRLRKPTLFQHMGLKSSFDTRKPNKLKDRYFGN